MALSGMAILPPRGLPDEWAAQLRDAPTRGDLKAGDTISERALRPVRHLPHAAARAAEGAGHEGGSSTRSIAAPGYSPFMTRCWPVYGREAVDEHETIMAAKARAVARLGRRLKEHLRHTAAMVQESLIVPGQSRAAE
ncbi:DNA-binding GntR family transcriptional regulator [Angulomicrobium tetraedrale]|uniref:DNA-binding GntR family transcriptional regulator n=1 Tax=Ancylobacter tetraedralis TaxID=217068 RepID=A0A839ZAQ1_9HYPH|nr:hypothetical protein [Ancylobacter tetraedralis]MBB3771796.1 DNA-binding GntR family transcriptional regulator [Ancylobacter tetraedralis]